MSAKHVYCIDTDDLQQVAVNEYGRRLSSNELKQISNKLGDYFLDWYEKIDNALFNTLNLKKKK